jgi:hypothetical protein
MSDWLRLASSRTVVRRALAYACVVGAVLIAINHGDALLRRDVTVGRMLKMLLTICVPYVVSTASSVGALRDSTERSRHAHDVRRPRDE